MRKLLLLIVIVSSSSMLSYGQYYIDYGFSAGASNYLGDIGGGSGPGRNGLADIRLDISRWTLGGFYRYRVAPSIAIKGALNYIRLFGDDSKTANLPRKGRNLNFKNDMFEFTANAELYIYKVNDVGKTGRYSTDFNLYLFGGLGLFYSNPKGQNVEGEWVSLQPLQSEGVSYGKFNFVIPAGIGFYYTINRRYRLGMEVGWRTTFTDYIDDVSDVYANDFDGITNKTNQELLDEINADNNVNPGLLLGNYDAGSRRGDPTQDDSYLTATINFSWTLRGSSKFYKSRHNWVLGRNKRRSRKSRAKF